MFRQHLKRLFSLEKSIKINIKQGSFLKKNMRLEKSYKQLAWEQKVCNEWGLIFVAAVVSFNIVYNCCPQWRISQNIFMNTDRGLVMEAKRQVETQRQEHLKQKQSKGQ